MFATRVFDVEAGVSFDYIWLEHYDSLWKGGCFVFQGDKTSESFLDSIIIICINASLSELLII